jgi:ribosome maturation factor RimP
LLDETGMFARFLFLLGYDLKLKKERKSQKDYKAEMPALRSPGDEYLKKPGEIVAKAWELGQPLCLSEGMELIHVEFQRESGGRILRLYIDKPGGITVDDCAAVSSQLGDILDIKLDTEFPYTLEVSSPGIDRPVSRLSDFKKFTGNTVKIKTVYPINGQKNFKGVLRGVLEKNIMLQTDTETVMIPYDDIIKARLVNFLTDSQKDRQPADRD